MDIDSVSRLKVDIAWYILVVDSLPLSVLHYSGPTWSSVFDLTDNCQSES